MADVSSHGTSADRDRGEAAADTASQVECAEWRVEHFRSHQTLIFSILITFGVPFLMEKMEKKNLWDENLVLNGFKNDFSGLPMSLPSKRIFSAFFAFTNLDQTSY